MQTMKLKVSVHRIAQELLPEIPDGEAEVVIHYEEKSIGGVDKVRRHHLEALLARIRAHSPNRTREDIDRQLARD